MMELYHQMPDMICPSCGGPWAWHDYYETKTGDDRECPLCGETAVVDEIECVMYVKLRSRDKKRLAEE